MAKTKIEVTEHDGTKHQTSASNYDAKTTFKELKEAQQNSSNDYVVVIGDLIIDARSVKSVLPIE